MKIRVTSDGEWDEAVSQITDSEFFQSRPWIEIWEKIHKGSKAKCYVAEDPAGGKIYLSGLEKKLFKGLVSRFDSSPEGTFGGIFSNGIRNVDLEKKIYQHIKTIMSYNIHQLIPFVDSDKQLISVEKGYRIEVGKDDPLSKCNRNTKRNIKKAISQHISIETSTDVLKWKEYYQMYVIASQRWGRDVASLYSFKVFETILEDKNIQKKLWLAYDKNIMIYGFLVFYFKNKCYAWHGCGLPTGLEKGAAHYLHYTILTHCAEAGYEYYDLMTNGGKKSITNFKNGFSPSEYDVYKFVYKRPVYLICEGISKLLHRRV